MGYIKITTDSFGDDKDIKVFDYVVAVSWDVKFNRLHILIDDGTEYIVSLEFYEMIEVSDVEITYTNEGED